MTMPAFLSKGTAVSHVGDACTGFYSGDVTLPGTIVAGDIIVILVGARVFSGTIDSIDTPSGYTLGASHGVGGTTAASYFYKVADGTEDGTTVTTSGTFNSFFMLGGAQAYVFNNSGTGGFHAVGGTNSGTGTSATIASVVTTEANELAVALLYTTLSTTPGSATGETGGDYTEAVAEDSPQPTLQIQTAQMASAGTISGGAITIGSTEWKTFSFALKEITSSIPNKLVRGNFAVKRASSF